MSQHYFVYYHNYTHSSYDRTFIRTIANSHPLKQSMTDAWNVKFLIINWMYTDVPINIQSFVSCNLMDYNDTSVIKKIKSIISVDS